MREIAAAEDRRLDDEPPAKLIPSSRSRWHLFPFVGITLPSPLTYRSHGIYIYI
ncbi:hypothetical protein ALC62_05381 [Cyphomyrmex costatus]|uniref:Uncharacterized protein n=1 Tax=Cyphomyrmex costatus TaxID=456900 RepID=A0A195CSR5_9HYME|nr:hypothetical protein ALC62_05381 [Cyphomyrmex costatus]